MVKTALAIILILFSDPGFGQALPLFKITQSDKVGFINEKGKVIINPVFLNGNDFSEGLAAVRTDGLYGFIDKTGTFVIKPSYDFATNFVNGLAVVYKDGEPLFIDKTGEIVLPRTYSSLYFIDNNKGIVTTHSKKQGIINLGSKRLVIDTVYSSTGEFKNGVSIVYEYLKPAQKQKNIRVGVIDSTGKFIVAFGKYEKIKPFFEGYASVEIHDKRNKDGNTDGVIDSKGNLLFKRPYKDNSYIDGDFHNGYAKINLYKHPILEKDGTSSLSEKKFQGFINLKGEVVFEDPNYSFVTDFSNGRAFIKENNKKYILIDKYFKRVGNNEFENISEEPFKNGYAIVNTSDGFGIIDTTGNFVTRSDYEEIDRAGIIDGYFFFSNESDEDEMLYGIADLKGNIITKPVMQGFDRKGFVNGLIKAVIDKKLSYINKNGDIVWQQQPDSSEALKPLNIDVMNRGYFYANSTPKNTNADISGGWATSQNKPGIIKDIEFPGNSLSITIDINSIDTFANRFYGFNLFISNTTIDTIEFNAQDSRLYMKLQAQNSKGEWKDIEYLPSSWCGNSYHTIELEPNAFWKFTIPKYEGEFQTKIRAQLRYIDKNNPKTQKIVYSNIINGSINPGQFWNKRTYHPNGLMDPYND
jgi:WG containing repeat